MKMKSLIIAAFLLLNAKIATAQYDKMLIGDNNNGQIVVSNIDGTSLDTFDLGVPYQSFYDADLDPIQRQIYMAHYWGIFKMNYDGSGFDTLISDQTGGYSDGVAVDAVEGYLYWGATQEKKIYRSDLNGNNVIVIYNATGHVTDVDLDLTTQRLYFGQWFSGERGIYSIDLMGSNLDTVITSGYDVHFLELDTMKKRIYFTDDGNAKCRRINYDGSNDTLLYDFQGGGFFVDTKNSLLYTTDISNNNVKVSDLNGGNAKDLFPASTLFAPFGPLLFSTLNSGVEKVTVPSVKATISPNPLTEFAILHTDKILKDASLEIWNVHGENVKQINHVFGKSVNIQRDNLTNGIYFVRLIQENKLIAVEKLIIAE